MSTEVYPVVIDGARRTSASGETLDAVNPATGELLGRIPRCGPADVDVAVAAAEAAFPAWRDTSATERAGRVLALADAVESHAEELALLDTRDNGTPLNVMHNDAFAAAAQLRYFAGLALQLRGETIPVEHGRLNYTLPQPFGVVGRIIPFNHPLMFAAGKLGAPLVAGNTVIVKPSEHTSLSALRLAELAGDILPPGVVGVITGLGAEVGIPLVEHPSVRRLAFTGSQHNGRAIQAQAARTAVKTVTLELGGKNPVIVFPDADLDAAVDGVIRGMNFTWQGQSCGSTSRLLVDRSIRPAFVERIAARLEAMRVGLPEDPGTDIGAIVNRSQLDKVLEYVQIGRDGGARLVCGGTVPDAAELAAGLFVRPALFDGVDPASRLAQEEIFGPVLAVLDYTGAEEALAIANGTEFGLTASVFTRDLATAHRFARDLRAGYVWVNETSRHVPGTGFGGVKESGVGREEGVDELYSYTESKNVHVNFG